MKYLCLGYLDSQTWAALGSDEREVMPADERFLEAMSICSDGAATTLRCENGNMLIAEVPLAAANEQLRSVIVLEAADLNHAVQLLERLPQLRRGGRIEIRRIAE